MILDDYKVSSKTTDLSAADSSKKVRFLKQTFTSGVSYGYQTVG